VTRVDHVLTALVSTPMPLITAGGAVLVSAVAAALVCRRCAHGQHQRRDGLPVTVWSLFERERAAEGAWAVDAEPERLARTLWDTVVISRRSVA
jgi:hypothetical protein